MTDRDRPATAEMAQRTDHLACPLTLMAQNMALILGLLPQT